MKIVWLNSNEEDDIHDEGAKRRVASALEAEPPTKKARIEDFAYSSSTGREISPAEL